MKPEIRIFRDLNQFNQTAAELFAERAAKAIQERGRFLVALNGGSTPAGAFKLLGTEFQEKVDWSNVHVLWGDERCVPGDDPESSYGQARGLFLRHVPIPETNVHRIKGELPPAEAAQEYAMVLKELASPPLEWPRFDLVYLGMGEDGHTASLFAGPDLQDALDAPKARRAVGVMPDPMPEDAPVPRITLTRAAILSARTVLFTLTGSEKRELLEQAIEDGQSSKLPVGRLLAEAEQPIDIHWAP